MKAKIKDFCWRWLWVLVCCSLVFHLLAVTVAACCVIRFTFRYLL